MSEAQVGFVIEDDEVVEEEVVEEQVEASTEETEETQETQETKVPDGFVPIEQNQKEVNKQHFKYQEEKRQREALELKLKQQQEELDKLTAVVVPPAPDQYDPEFGTKVQQREEAIRLEAERDGERKALEREQQQAQEARDRNETQALEVKVKEYGDRSIALGLNPVDVGRATQQVINSGLPEVLDGLILEDPEGPLIAQYLSVNPIELEALKDMTPYGLMNYVNSDVRQKAQSMKPKTSQAPDPQETLKGGGAKEPEDPSLKGVIFE